MTDATMAPAYTITARMLHWVTAALVLLTLPLGLVIAQNWGGPLQDQLYDLHEKAEEQRKTSKPEIEEFLVLLDENPHIGAEEKKRFSASLSEQPAADTAVETYLVREIKFDSDIWIVEVEDRNGRNFLDVVTG